MELKMRKRYISLWNAKTRYVRYEPNYNKSKKIITLLLVGVRFTYAAII